MKTFDEPFAAFNTGMDALGHSAALGDIPVNENLIQGDDGGTSADILLSEVTALVPQAPADPSERPNVRERAGSPNSALNTVPDDRQTESNRANKVDQVQKGIEEGTVTSPLDGDVSDLITHVSERAICTNGRFGDIFTGIHKEKGK
ncbi:hypothetical protein FRC01_002211 [Tulasnella sp. 417]|nr:hypothetical protein FRC01_002211 [Tulasnella sp. 417]